MAMGKICLPIPPRLSPSPQSSRPAFLPRCRLPCPKLTRIFSHMQHAGKRRLLKPSRLGVQRPTTRKKSFNTKHPKHIQTCRGEPPNPHHATGGEGGEPPKPTPEPHHTTGRGETTHNHTTPQGGEGSNPQPGGGEPLGGGGRGVGRTGIIYTTILELGPQNSKRPSLSWFGGPNSMMVVYMEPLGK